MRLGAYWVLGLREAGTFRIPFSYERGTPAPLGRVVPGGGSGVRVSRRVWPTRCCLLDNSVKRQPSCSGKASVQGMRFVLLHPPHPSDSGRKTSHLNLRVRCHVNSRARCHPGLSPCFLRNRWPCLAVPRLLARRRCSRDTFPQSYITKYTSTKVTKVYMYKIASVQLTGLEIYDTLPKLHRCALPRNAGCGVWSAGCVLLFITLKLRVE